MTGNVQKEKRPLSTKCVDFDVPRISFLSKRDKTTGNEAFRLEKKLTKLTFS